MSTTDDLCKSWKEEIDTLESALSEALAALRAYGRHALGCPFRLDTERRKLGGYIDACTCGLDTALRKGEGRDG